MLEMESIAQLLAEPGTVYVFVAVILLVALRPLYLAILGISAVNRDLDQAIRILGMVGKEHIQDEFYNQFKDINNRISKIQGLRHAWREFVDSMYVGNAATNKRAYLSHRPSHYFNRDSVLGTRLNLSQFLAYPNYLIGIGLTFTFIGLAAALHVAQSGLASGAGQQALKDLLAVASVKFISSIVGIASSLLISGLQRIRIMTFQQKLNTFCDMLEDCTEYKSTEKLLHDSFHEQRRQTATLGGLGASIGAAVTEALGSQLSASVATALAPLMAELRALGRTFTGNCEEALNKVLVEFLSRLRQSSMDDLQGMIDSTRTVKGQLDELAVRMESAGQQLGAATRESGAQFGGMLERFDASLAPMRQSMDQSMGQFAQAMAALEALSAKIGQAGEQIHTAAEHNKQSAATFGKTVSDMTGQLTPVAEVLSGLSQSLAKVQLAVPELKDAGATIAAAAEGFRQCAHSIGQVEGRMSEGFGAMDSHLGKALSDLSRGSEEFRTGVQSFVQLIDEQFTRIIVGLTSAIGELAKASNLEKKEESYFTRLKSKWGK